MKEAEGRIVPLFIFFLIVHFFGYFYRFTDGFLCFLFVYYK